MVLTTERKRLERLVLLTLFLTSLIIWGGGCGRNAATGGDINREEEAVLVETVTASLGRLECEISVSGKIGAFKSAYVLSKIPGRVASVHVKEGDRVSAGQVLVTLDDTDLVQQVSLAEAGVMSAESALVNAKAAFEVAADNYLRGKELLEEGAISEAVFQADYELKYIQARELCERGAPAQLKQARANLALAEKAYRDSRIKSPINGVVVSRNINPGEMVSNVPSMTMTGTPPSLITVFDIDKVVVKASVGEKIINRLKKGQTVEIRVDAVSGRPFQGIVATISPAADANTKSFPVEFEVENPDHLLKPGMFATVDIGGDEREQFLLIPRQAVLNKDGKSAVWLAVKGKARQKSIEIGQSDDKNIVVVSGIKRGDEVIVAGQEGLSDGALVKVKKAK